MFDRHDLLQPPPWRLMLVILIWVAVFIEGGCLLIGQSAWSLRLTIVATFLIMVLGVVIRLPAMIILLPLIVAMLLEFGYRWAGFGVQTFWAALLTAATWPRQPPPQEVPHG